MYAFGRRRSNLRDKDFKITFSGTLEEDPEDYIDHCEGFWTNFRIQDGKIPQTALDNLRHKARCEEVFFHISRCGWRCFKARLRNEFGINKNKEAVLEKLKTEVQTVKIRGSEYVYSKRRLADRLERIGYEITSDMEIVQQVISMMTPKYKEIIDTMAVENLDDLERVVLSIDFPDKFDVNNPDCEFDREEIEAIKVTRPYKPEAIPCSQRFINFISYYWGKLTNNTNSS